MGCVHPPNVVLSCWASKGHVCVWLRVGWTLAKPRGASLHPWTLAFLPTALPVLSSEALSAHDAWTASPHSEGAIPTGLCCSR